MPNIKVASLQSAPTPGSYIGKRRYFNRDAKGNINFHTYKYNGFFTFHQDGSPEYHHIKFDKPLPEGGEELTWRNANDKYYRYLDETPYVSGNYWVALISREEYGEQVLASKALKTTRLSSRQDASYFLTRIIGVNNQGFIGDIYDGYETYSELIRYGFPRADAATETMLRNDEGTVMIQYIMK